MKALLLPVTVLLALASAPLTAADEKTVVGRIGDLDVKLDELRASLAGLGENGEAAMTNDPALLNQVVRSLLVQRVLLKEALTKKWDARPEVAAQLERVRESTITESYLQSLSVPPDTFPSEAEVKAAYEVAKPALLTPKSWRLAQIFIAVPADAPKEEADKAAAKLETVRKALKAPGADFAALAAAHSDEQTSAGRGGEIGWLAEAQIQPEIRGKITPLSLNALSEPVKLNDGWHVIKVLDIREANTPTLEQVRPKLVQQLRAEKTRANSQAHLTRLLQENPVAVNELELQKALGKK